MGNLGYEGQKNAQPSWTPTKTPFQPSIITRTPFQPIHPTPLQHHLSTKTPEQPSSNFNGIDFYDQGQWLHIKIIPPDKRVNRGKPIVISFIPGQKCNYGDQRACISTYQSTMESEIVFITVHSGVVGEGQAFRHAVEGTGINSASFSLKEVRNNLRSLDGAEVVIIQGDNRFDGYTLVATARVPPVSMDSYFEKPVKDALSMASSIDPSQNDWVDPILPQIVFETCGWRIPGERWAPGISSTTASVYIGVIQIMP
jgi:hypothetical protein